jgi:hypothetical protein
MKSVLLCAALSFVLWTAPSRAEELCIGLACVGEHHDRDRDEGREHREHRDRDESREERREHRDHDEGREHREHRDRDELCVGPACIR